MKRFAYSLSISLSIIFVALYPVFAADSENNTDTLRVTLIEAILTALENNPAVSIQRLGADINAERVSSEKAAFYPELSASATKSETEAERRVGSLKEPVSVTDERTSYSVELRGTAPTGTQISADLTLDGSVSSLYSDQYVGRFGLTVTQSLLKGLTPAAYLAALRQARLDLELSRAELKAIAEQVVFDAERAYWNLYLAIQAVHIREESMRLAQRQLDETMERIAVGRLAELEQASVEAELAARRVDLLDARNILSEARLELTYLLNQTQDGWDKFILTREEPTIPEDTLSPLEQHLEMGRMYRSDLIQARLELKKGNIAVAKTKNGLLPRLDLFINLGRSAYAGSFSDVVPDLDSPFRDVSAGLTLTLPVPGGRQSADYHQALLTAEQRELMLDNMERLMERDVRSAYLQIQLARERIQATRVARELQEKNYAAELEKFRVGKSTNLQVALVERNFTEAQLDETRARVSFLMALTSLYLSEGTLLQRRGVETFVASD